MTLHQLPDVRETIIVCGTTCRKPLAVLQPYLASLDWQDLPSRVKLVPAFVLDFTPEQADARQYLEEWVIQRKGVMLDAPPSPTVDFSDDPRFDAHQWNGSSMSRVGESKNKILAYANSIRADYVFFADSDLILDRTTLRSLLEADKPITTAVYWTHWTKRTTENTKVLAGPQVWLTHPYGMSGRGMEEAEFRAKLLDRGLHRVWGFGACTLIGRRALDAGINFSYVPEVSTTGLMGGEDRHFCIRAERSHIDAYADCWPDIFHCFSADTEILVDGIDRPEWIRGDQVTKDHRVAAWDPTTNALNWENPTEIIRRQGGDELLAVEQRDGVNFHVTPEHGVWHKTEKTKTYRRDTALVVSQSPGAKVIPRNALLADLPGTGLPSAMLRVLGYVQSDGWLQQRCGAVFIGQSSRSPICQKIRDALNEAGLAFTESEEGREGEPVSINPKYFARDNMTKFYIHARDGIRVRELLGEHKLRVPPLLWARGTREEVLMYLEACRDGDGTQISKHSFIIYSMSKEYADDLQGLAVSRGIGSLASLNSNGVWRVSIMPHRQTATIQKKDWKRIPNTEPYVWCVTVPSGAVLVRRNGRTSILSNCYHADQHVPRIPEMLARLGSTHPEKAQLGDLVSLRLRPLEPIPVSPTHMQQAFPQVVRGRLGTIPMVPELEEAIYSLSRGQTAIVSATFPMHHPIAYFRGRKRLIEVTLVDVKANNMPPTIENDFVLGPNSGKWLYEKSIEVTANAR